MSRDDAPSAAQIEDRIDSGIRNLWYPVLASWQLADTPLGITRLGERIVLWRDGDRIHAVQDRCPHRGARLSLGFAAGQHIACWYHGVKIGCAGDVAAVPAARSEALSGKKILRAYETQERHGAIFLWFGTETPPPLELPEELSSPAFTGFLCTAIWRANYRYAHDNLMDLMHGAYLHAASHSMAGGKKTAEMKLRRAEHGFRFQKTDQAGENFDWVEFGDTGAHWMRTTVPYGPQAGPGGPFWIIGMVAPIDRLTCQVFFWRLRQVSGWQAASWRFLYRTRLEERHWRVLEQDRVMVEGLDPDARDAEHLYAHDAGLIRLRQALAAAARRELAAERPADAPPAGSENPGGTTEAA